MDTYNIYKDIQARTNGEIYIGVVGQWYVQENPPLYADSWSWRLCLIWQENLRNEIRDQLPLSGSGN